MKALLFEKYGKLSMGNIPKPEPKEDQVQIKIKYSALNAGDWHLRDADPFVIRFMFGLLKPKVKVLGNDFYGEITKLGTNVKEFKIGDKVFGALSSSGFGGFAEYACASQNNIIKAGKDEKHYAAVCGAGIPAIQAVNLGEVTAKDKVLVKGASGGVGSFVVQICKSKKAHVTALASKSKTSYVKKLGADKVINEESEEIYDVIIDCAAFQDVSKYKNLVRKNYVFVGGSTKQLFKFMIMAPFYSRSGAKFRNFLAKDSKENLQEIKNLSEKNVLKSQVDKLITLNEVNKYLNQLKEGKAKGKILVKI